MIIDVILATYNRAFLLPRALDSVVNARIPLGVSIRVIVVDNNSSDNTKEVVFGYMGKYPKLFHYEFEGRQGKNFALNRAIAICGGDIVAMFDDDEKISEDWFEVIADDFKDPMVDFTGGPCRPEWETAPPTWLPPKYGGVLGIIDAGPCRARFEPGFAGMLVGGNCAIRRATLLRCTPYPDEAIFAEDRYLYQELLKMGACGYYQPAMLIYHWIPRVRLRKQYFREWAFREGINVALLGNFSDEKAMLLLGIPRWRYMQFFRSCLRLAIGVAKLKYNDPLVFLAELNIHQFLGFLSHRLGRRSIIAPTDRAY